MTATPDGRHPASFRDPSGHLFYRDGVLHRHVGREYAEHYDALIASGLHGQLVASGRMVAHEEAPGGAEDAHRILRPEPVPFVSYPYEWCFSQLRDAALLTLDLLETGLARGLVLKDASAFNVQFVGPRPMLVDTLSFEVYREGEPWVAYRQFCEHFLAPLALLAHVDTRLSALWRTFLDGVPLDLASRLLPRRTLSRFGLLTHLHLHARSQAHFADRPAPRRAARVSRRSLLALADSLRGAVAGLSAPPLRSEWSDYDRTHDYAAGAQQLKERTVAAWLGARRPRTVWDLGANVGRFSRLALEAGAFVVAFDADAAVVEAAYRSSRREGATRLLPLVVDLCNPSPGLGWDGREREPLERRGPADLAMALALVHHLSLGRNVPLPLVAAWMARFAGSAIVEFVPKEDPQAQRLLRSRADVFSAYNREGFEAAFRAHFRLEAQEALPDSGRVLYWWTRE